MSLKNDAERIFDVNDRKGSEPDFLAAVTLQVEFSNGYRLSSRIFVHGDIEDVFGTALNSICSENVGAKGRCQIRTVRAPYSAHCLRVPSVETAGEQVAQGFWDMVGCEKWQVQGSILNCW